ncbi:MAG: hypothetical protein KA105_02490 [Caulobacter sp.]|nr:hypothetical protein [Caulobacter sp.]
MPQASDDLRAEMEQRFGDPVDSAGPIRFLRERGWTLHRDWTWSKPGQGFWDIPEDEAACIHFLVDEWDFGGVRDGDAYEASPQGNSGLPQNPIQQGEET